MLKTERVLPVIGLLVLLGLWTAAAIRTVSYVNSNDPRVYIVLARQLLAAPAGSPEWLAAFREVAPGFPLILAGAIRCFGIFAPYWTNYVLGVLWGGALLGLFRRMTASRESVVPALAGTVAFLFLADPQHVSFLLEPYRELAAFLFMILGLWAFLAGWTDRRHRLLLLSACCFVLAGLVREATLLAAAGPLAALLTARDRPWTDRGRAAAGLLLPLLMLAVAACFALGGSSGGITQARNWIGIAMSGGPGVLWPRWSSNFIGYAVWLCAKLGWPGLVLLALGLWRTRRQRSVPWLFLLPALLLLAAYSTFIVERRYVLSLLVPLLPLVGAGVLQAADWADAAARRVKTAWPGGRSGAVITGGLCLVLAGAVHRLPGGLFSRADAMAFRDALQRTLDPADLVLYDVDCREAHAAITCYTSIEGGWRFSPELLSGSRRAIYYLEPRNEACHTRAQVQAHGIRMSEVIRSRGNVREVEAPLRLGPQHFALCRLEPYASTTVAHPLALPGTAPAVLWVDLRGAPAEQLTQARLESTEGRTLAEGPLWKGGGWKAWYLPEGPANREEAQLTLESAEVLRTEADPLVRRADTAVTFEMANSRRYSTMAWFQPPFIAGDDRDKYGRLLQGEGRLEIPVPQHAPDGAVLHMALTLSPAGRSTGLGTVTIEMPGGFSAADTLLFHRPQQTVRYRLPLPAGEDTLRLRVELKAGQARPAPVMRVLAVTLGPIE